MKRAMHDFLLSPGDFLLGVMIGILGLIAGIGFVAFWLAFAAAIIYGLGRIFWALLF
jgi:hypothetical protein